MINIKKLIKKRIISANPDLVLDAPRMINDYYLNLLDWSNKNMVAVGLDKNVYRVKAFANTRSGTRIINNKISSLSWSEDGDHLAVGLNDGILKYGIFLSGHTTCVVVIAWNKQIIASGSRDGSMIEVCGLKWRSDGEQLASGGNNDNKVNIWDAKSSIPKFTKTDHKAAAIAWCPWQRILLATGEGAADQQIYFLNTDASVQLKSINTQSQVTSIVWSNHYKEVLSIHEYPNFQFTIWKYPSLKKIIDVKDAHENRILQSALSPEGEIVATVAEINYC
nr:6731_t:CDS:2 [Entrophospora candida]